jgi:plasmid maintenance system antidote protein VapI
MDPMASDRLQRRLAELDWPTPALDQPELAPGQLWRASWHETAGLVVILGNPSGRTVNVAAASANATGDDKTLVASTGNSMTPTVWAGLTADIKTFTLEHRITDLTAKDLGAVRAVVAGSAPGHWAPIVDDLDDRALVRAELADRLEKLAEAEWIPKTDTAAPRLSDLAKKSGMTASRLGTELHISPGDARRLLQEKREPTPSEVGILTSLFGTTPSGAMELDADLLVEMDLPEFRSALERRAHRLHTGDTIASRRTFAASMTAQAARQRETGRRNWRALIREALHED